MNIERSELLVLKVENGVLLEYIPLAQVIR